MSMAEMQLREVARGDFLWMWTASGSRPAADELTMVWPEACSADATHVRCGANGLTGKLAIEGIGQRYSAAMIKIFWQDGQSRVYTLTSAQRQVHLYGSADDPRGMSEVARAYTALGVEHILTGFDHLLFVVALLFLVGFNRRLLWTITGFTAAHSLTLALSALGWISLRPAPVEAAIALSVMLVVGEALNSRPTLARRWPALVALLFGLVHGLGFAGALKEIGLPEHHLLMALLTFNVGVEIGQMAVVAAAFLVFRQLQRAPQLAVARTPLLYFIGVVAAYWSIARIVSMVA
jgi:hydrogenase/urease accessory protein HupE